MASNHDAPIRSHDDTALFRHRSKSYSIDDEISLAWVPGGGIDWWGFGGGVAAAVVSVAPAVLLLSFFGQSWLWSALIVLIPGGIVYQQISRDSGGQITPMDKLLLRLDYIFLQPSMIDGIGGDTSADELHWQLILYRPMGIEIATYTPHPATQYGINRERQAS